MEISFEKRYVVVYTLIISLIHHIILNINSIFENLFQEAWPVDAILLIFTLIFLSIFNRDQKQRVALGFFYTKTPFERAEEYIENDSRIDKTNKELKKLHNIKNKDFYREFYKPVRDISVVETKNSEYCIIRDIVFTIFVFVIVFAILTFWGKQYFLKELIVIIVAYIVGVVSCRMKAKEFVTQVVVEKINKKE